MGGSSPTAGGTHTRNRRLTLKTKLYLVGIASTAVVAILVVLAVVPVTHPFAFQFTSGGEGQTFPEASSVSFTWQSSSGSIDFELIDPGGSVVYSSYSTAGSYTFTSVGGQYIFTESAYTGGTVTVYGNYSAPLL